MITQYEIVRETSSSEATRVVNGMIKNGWQPYGSLQVATSGVLATTWSQAMVKHSEPQPQGQGGGGGYTFP